MTRVYALYRVSSKGQVDHDDIPMQRIACTEYAAAQPGWEIVKEFYEKGISGYKVSAGDRDAIIQIKADAEAGKFDVLLVFMFDRLGRKDSETPFVVKGLSQYIRIISVKEGEQRFDSHTDDLMNYIRFWQASGESAKTSMRVKTKHLQMTLAGEYRGGLVPFGYDAVYKGRVNKKDKPVKDLVINEGEAAIKREIYHRVADLGWGSHRIANWLNEAGIKTKRGTTLWRDTSVRAMIGNPIDIGKLHMGDTQSETFEALRIVDDDLFYRAQRMIVERAPTKAGDSSIPMRTDAGGLLTGFIYCAECGQRLCINHCRKVTKLSGGGQHLYEWDVYRCYRKVNSRRTCAGQSTYKAERLESEVLRIVHAFLNRVCTMPHGVQLDTAMRREQQIWTKRLKDAETAVTKASKAVTALEEQAILALTGESALDLAIINQLMPKKKTELTQAQEQYEKVHKEYDAESQRAREKETQLTGILKWADIFDNASREEQHMIIAQLVKRVEIGTGYDMKITMNMSLLQFLSPDMVSETIEACAAS